MEQQLPLQKLGQTPDFYAQLAQDFFLQGYNCSQSVLLAFAEELGLSQEMAARVASSFGGGMGRMREVCGAVSGMFLVLGLYCGYTDPNETAAKKNQYREVQELAAFFREKNGAILCRELLGLEQTGASHYVPEQRTPTYYKKRPCKQLVEDAARIVAAFLQQKS